MTPKRELLMQVIEGPTSHMAANTATERLNQLRKAGVEGRSRVRMGWSINPANTITGSGTDVLIEFDNTQNNGNHVHSVWRDFSATSGATFSAPACQGVRIDKARKRQRQNKRDNGTR